MQDTPDSTIGSLLREGMAQQQQGRLDRAEVCYRSVLKRIPGDPDLKTFNRETPTRPKISADAAACSACVPSREIPREIKSN